MKPLAIEIFSGLHGWGAGLAAAGFRVVGFDVVDMPRLLNHPVPEHCSLVLQDVLTLHGSQFRDAHLIVASPPCPEYSYMAMPFSRGKRIAAALRGQGEFPDGYTGSRTIPELTALFDACFRIQREAIEATGKPCPACDGLGPRHRNHVCPRCNGACWITRHIPMVVENVRGAQPWVGRAKWSYGSYYLWGDVPALMPTTIQVKNAAVGNGSWFAIEHGKDNGQMYGASPVRGVAIGEGQKVPGMNFHDHEKTGKPGRSFQSAAVKTVGHLNCSLQRKASSGSTSRRAASALIAKIPFALAEHIGKVYYAGETP